MSGTVPPPPPGHDGRPPTVPPAAGVRRVASAYQSPSAVDPMAEVPLQQVTAPAAMAAPAAPTAHAPVPPPPDAAPSTTPAPPVYQPTQQIPPASYGQQPSYAPAPPSVPAGQPGYPAQPGYAAPTGYQSGYEPAYQGGYQAAQAQPVAATQVQQPVYTQPAPAAQPPGGAYPGAGAAVPPPPEPPRRRRLSAGWIAFIAIDVVLIALAAVFAVQILTSSSPNPPDAGADAVTTPAPSVSASEDAPMQGAALAKFAAPSKNITCTIYADGVSCGIAQLNQQPAPVDGCDGTTGYVATVDSDGNVKLPCVPTDQQPKKAGGKVDTLDYGKSLTEGDFTCTSEQTGMSCTHDPTGKGFSLARAGIGQS
ncbi:hypothetical protein [Isoptericola sp. NPDC057653]|uniref:hypothetical protein n=1 Tax=Isoptericola sp. NPDC057653 TaxID=3346195 RepID=UPI00367E902F